MSFENPAAQPVESARTVPTIEALAPSLQTDGAALKTQPEVENKTLQTAGLAPAEDFFGPASTSDRTGANKMDVSQGRSPLDLYEASEPRGIDDYSKLSGENVSRLNDLKRAGLRASQNGGDTAATLKSLQDQADRFGRNRDGSPRVSILAYQSRDTTRETNFYATFNTSKEHQLRNQQTLEAARQFGTRYPSETVGHIGRMRSRGPVA